jgi:hypothetical protein
MRQLGHPHETPCPAEQLPQTQAGPCAALAQLVQAQEDPCDSTWQFAHSQAESCPTRQLAQLQESPCPVLQLGHPHPKAWLTFTAKEAVEAAKAVGARETKQVGLLLPCMKAEASGVLQTIQTKERTAVGRSMVAKKIDKQEGIKIGLLIVVCIGCFRFRPCFDPSEVYLRHYCSKQWRICASALTCVSTASQDIQWICLRTRTYIDGTYVTSQ